MLITRGPEFYKRFFQRNIEGRSVKVFPTFTVTILNTKITSAIAFHPLAPTFEYHQNASNSCCFNSLASSFTASGEHSGARAIVLQI